MLILNFKEPDSLALQCCVISNFTTLHKRVKNLIQRDSDQPHPGAGISLKQLETSPFSKDTYFHTLFKKIRKSGNLGLWHWIGLETELFPGTDTPFLCNLT